MNAFKYFLLICLVAVSFFWSRLGHAATACENTPVPVGWVVTGVDSGLKNPCAPSRQLTIEILPAKATTMSFVCTNSKLPPDWVYTGNITSGYACSPYKTMVIGKATFSSGEVCDLSPTPEGYIVTAITASALCAPYRQFSIRTVPSNLKSIDFVYTNSTLPPNWVFTGTLTSKNCDPYQTMNISTAAAAAASSGKICDLGTKPAGYVVNDVSSGNPCLPNRTLNILKIVGTNSIVACTNSVLPLNWVYSDSITGRGCEPFLKMSASYPSAARDNMCDITPVPVGYVVDSVSIDARCSPYKKFSIKKI